jgi:hypothetical protein
VGLLAIAGGGHSSDTSKPHHWEKRPMESRLEKGIFWGRHIVIEDTVKSAKPLPTGGQYYDFGYRLRIWRRKSHIGSARLMVTSLLLSVDRYDKMTKNNSKNSPEIAIGHRLYGRCDV